MRKHFLIGVDPGVCTGFAVWDQEVGKFELITSCTILNAMRWVNDWKLRGKCSVWVEDARQRKWFGGSGREKLMGAGSIKRDCQIWEEFLHSGNLPYRFIPPKDIRTKLNAKKFKAMTGWQNRTNSHGRDAAMIVFGA